MGVVTVWRTIFLCHFFFFFWNETNYRCCLVAFKTSGTPLWPIVVPLHFRVNEPPKRWNTCLATYLLISNTEIVPPTGLMKCWIKRNLHLAGNVKAIFVWKADWIHPNRRLSYLCAAPYLHELCGKYEECRKLLMNGFSSPVFRKLRPWNRHHHLFQGLPHLFSYNWESRVQLSSCSLEKEKIEVCEVVTVLLPWGTFW